MKYKITFLIASFLLLLTGSAQQQTEKTHIRLVDTLSKQERANRNPFLLKTELDSLIQVHNAGTPLVQQVPVKEIVREIPEWVTATGVFALLVVGILLYLLFGYHRRLTKTVADLKRLIQNFDFYAAPVPVEEKNGRGRGVMEKKIAELSAALEHEKETSKSIMQEYGMIKQAIAEVYKVRNYPFFDKQKNEGQLVLDLFATEKAVAQHAFEKFVKPAIIIADANKNNPARISQEDSDRILELLISLSLYHIEYLYLRINDLSVGGHIVQRIGSNGRGIDPALLKKLNIEHGSRALALRMALNRARVDKLSYPIFDETDLNNY